MQYRPELDGLRGIAVLAVLLVHTSLVGAGPDFGARSADMPILLRGGVYGVDIFFVLSGFLITRILLDEHRKTGRIALSAFYMRRALRLLPALLLTLLGCTGFMALTAPSGFTIAKSVLPALFYISNFAHIRDPDSMGMLTQTWSLAVEEQFYSLWPLALIALLPLSGRRLAAVVLGLAFASIVVRAALFVEGALLWANYSLPARADGLLFGAAVAILAGRLPTWGWLAPASAAILAIILIAAPLTGPVPYLAAYAVAGLASAGLIAGLPHSERMRRALGFGPLAWTGKVSYGIYLCHIPVFCLTPMLTPPVSIPLAIAVSFVVAALSYYCVERRFLALKSRYQAATPAGPRPREGESAVSA